MQKNVLEQFNTSAEHERPQDLNVLVTVKTANKLQKSAANSRNQTTNFGGFTNPKWHNILT